MEDSGVVGRTQADAVGRVQEALCAPTVLKGRDSQGAGTDRGVSEASRDDNAFATTMAPARTRFAGSVMADRVRKSRREPEASRRLVVNSPGDVPHEWWAADNCRGNRSVALPLQQFLENREARGDFASQASGDQRSGESRESARLQFDRRRQFRAVGRRFKQVRALAGHGT